MNKKNKRKPIKGNKFNYGGFGGSTIFNTPQVQNIQPIQPQLATVQPNMPSTSQISSMMQQTAAANPIQQASGSGLLGSVGGVGGAVGIAQGAAGLATQIANNLSVPEIKQEDMTAKSKGDLFTRANEFTNSGGYKVGRTNPLTSGISGLATLPKNSIFWQVVCATALLTTLYATLISLILTDCTVSNPVILILATLLYTANCFIILNDVVISFPSISDVLLV